MRRVVLSSVLRIAFFLALLTPLAAQAGEAGIPYSPQAVQAALADGRAVLLEFVADW